MPGINGLNPDTRLLHSAVAEAGARALTFFGRDPQVWEKEGHGPVSEADFAANDVLHNQLMSERPDYGWLSEETADTPDRLARNCVWIVDPIDGTRAFIEGKPEFTICAALAQGGKIIAGSVLNPATGEHFTAQRGAGAFLNGERLKMPDPQDGAARRMLTTKKSVKEEHWPGGLPEMSRGYVNSIAYRVCLVASGKWDACLSANGFSEWDIAAAEIILREAGGAVSDWAGADFAYNQPTTRVHGLMAASAPLYHELLQRRGHLSQL